MLHLLSQWMESGSPGLYGQAALKPVEGGASKETEFVMGPFLEGRLALESEKRSGAVVRRDVQVSEREHRLLCQQYYIKDSNLCYVEILVTSTVTA